MHIMTALCYWTVEQWLTICKQELCIPHLGEPHEIENKREIKRPHEIKNKWEIKGPHEIENKWEIKRPHEIVFVQNMRDKTTSR